MSQHRREAASDEEEDDEFSSADEAGEEGEFSDSEADEPPAPMPAAGEGAPAPSAPIPGSALRLLQCRARVDRKRSVRCQDQLTCAARRVAEPRAWFGFARVTSSQNAMLWLRFCP